MIQRDGRRILQEDFDMLMLVSDQPTTATGRLEYGGKNLFNCLVATRWMLPLSQVVECLMAV
jgi:hypothetical protein